MDARKYALKQNPVIQYRPAIANRPPVSMPVTPKFPSPEDFEFSRRDIFRNGRKKIRGAQGRGR